MKKLRIRFEEKEPCLIINRPAFHNSKLVYIICANKKIRYRYGRSSKIVYIGTTKTGARRIASSAVWRGEDLLYRHGIRQIVVHVVTCGKVQGAESWRKLEGALIYNFREHYGSIPIANKNCPNIDKENTRKYFSEEKIEDIIKQLS